MSAPPKFATTALTAFPATGYGRELFISGRVRTPEDLDRLVAWLQSTRPWLGEFHKGANDAR